MVNGKKWEIGQSVRLGGRELFVTGTLPPAAKGLAGRYVLETLDRSKAYEWTPFRGLRLVRGELVRPARAAKRKAARAKAASDRRRLRAGKAGPAQVTTAGNRVMKATGFWKRVLARIRPAVNQPEMHQNRAAQEAPSGPISDTARAQ